MMYKSKKRKPAVTLEYMFITGQLSRAQYSTLSHQAADQDVIRLDDLRTSKKLERKILRRKIKKTINTKNVITLSNRLFTLECLLSRDRRWLIAKEEYINKLEKAIKISSLKAAYLEALIDSGLADTDKLDPRVVALIERGNSGGHAVNLVKRRPDVSLEDIKTKPVSAYWTKNLTKDIKTYTASAVAVIDQDDDTP